MRRTSKTDSRVRSLFPLVSRRPTVETLEDRLPPGDVLLGGVAVSWMGQRVPVSDPGSVRVVNSEAETRLDYGRIAQPNSWVASEIQRPASTLLFAMRQSRSPEERSATRAESVQQETQALSQHKPAFRDISGLDDNLLDQLIADDFDTLVSSRSSSRSSRRVVEIGDAQNSAPSSGETAARALSVSGAAGAEALSSPATYAQPTPWSSVSGVGGENAGLGPLTLATLAQISSTLSTGTENQAVSEAAAAKAYGGLPLDFEANLGQADLQVKFMAHGPGYTLFLTGTEAVMVLPKPAGSSATNAASSATMVAAGPAQGPGTDREAAAAAEPSVLRMELLGANAAAAVVGQEKLVGKSNYFEGNDPSKWVTDVPHYARVTYEQVYPGVDLVYYAGQERQLEYDWVVAPGADPRTIHLAYQGAQGLRIDPQGNLLLQTGSGEVTEHRPVIYQDLNGVRQAIAGHYILEGTQQVGFELGAYDASRSLVIDPVRSYSTYLGGNGSDEAKGIAYKLGKIYLTGRAGSGNFPIFNPLPGHSMRLGFQDAFVTALDISKPPAQQLVYSTYLGGSGPDVGNAIAVDGQGNAFVTGNTQSMDFPTTMNGAFRSLNGPSDAFVTVLSPSGSSLVWSTFLGGSGGDVGLGIAADDNGSGGAGGAWVTGYTNSNNPSDFPQGVIPGFQSSSRSPTGTNYNDAFLARFLPTGELRYTSYLGGTKDTFGNGIALPPSGASGGGSTVYLTGNTNSDDLQTTAGGYQPRLGGGIDAFVAEIDISKLPAQQLVYLTYLGGDGNDIGKAIAVDALGNAYVTGSTTKPTSTPFPVDPNAIQPTYAGPNDPNAHNAFVTKLTPDGSGLVYSTYLGGNVNDVGNAIAVDAYGDAYVTGFTASTNFRTTVYADQTAPGGVSATNAFVTELNVTGTELVYSSYFGGNNDDEAAGIALDNSGNAYVAGFATSMGLATMNAYQPGLLGVENAFIAALAIPQIRVVDVIPTGESAESALNSEPSIAVSPTQTNNMLISAFGVNAMGMNPYFTTSNGGATWNHFAIHNYTHMDTTVAWSASTRAYAAILVPGAMPSVVVNTSPNPQINAAANQFTAVANSTYSAGAFRPDQPHLVATNVGGSDRVYVGINDLNQGMPPFIPGGTGTGRTAMVRYSLNPQAAMPMWTNVVIETVVPGIGGDGAVYMAANQNRIYAIFPRYNAVVGPPAAADARGDLVIVRDDMGGANSFTNLSLSIPPASGVVFPLAATTLGTNRLNSSFGIIVDPNNDRKVFVAWTDVNAGMPQVHVARSVDAGSTWSVQLNLPLNTGLPALAIANNGTVGLLYTRFTTSGNLETHFVQTRDDFASSVDSPIKSFPDNEFVMPPQPYIGEYEGLVAVGNMFYGTFSASNNPIADRVHFPRGVFFQRFIALPRAAPVVAVSNAPLLVSGRIDDGSGMLIAPNTRLPGLLDAISIDPYFFTARAYGP